MFDLIDLLKNTFKSLENNSVKNYLEKGFLGTLSCKKSI